MKPQEDHAYTRPVLYPKQNREEGGQEIKLKLPQSRTLSAVESVANVVCGYAVALVGQLVIYRILEIDVPLAQNLLIGFWFTLLSFARSYLLRRWFDGYAHSVMPR